SPCLSRCDRSAAYLAALARLSVSLVGARSFHRLQDAASCNALRLALKLGSRAAVHARAAIPLGPSAAEAVDTPIEFRAIRFRNHRGAGKRTAQVYRDTLGVSLARPGCLKFRLYGLLL